MWKKKKVIGFSCVKFFANWETCGCITYWRNTREKKKRRKKSRKCLFLDLHSNFVC